MRITAVKTARLQAHWGPWRRKWLLVRIDTDEGISGYGEASSGNAGPALEASVLGFKPLLLGQDPTNVEALFRQMVATAYAGCHASHFDSGVTVHAASGLETALWDLAGKAAGLPVHKLLGGKHRDRIRIYCCVGFLPTYLEMKPVYQEMGITCLKFDTTAHAVSDMPGALMEQHLTRQGLRQIVALVERIRSEVDDNIELAVEGRCGTVANAIRFLTALEPYDLAWAEDLIPPTDVDAWKTITAASRTPTLTGEGLHLRHEFLEYYRKDALRFAAPDFQVCGGLAEGKKIAEMADLHHLLVCPHNASSPIGIAAALHACAAIPNLLALEFHAMPGWDRLLTGYRPQIREGHIEVPNGPGLGVELDEAKTRQCVMDGSSYFE